MPWGNNDNDNANTPDNFGNGESYGGATHGADSNGDPVTFAVRGNDLYISGDHIDNDRDFWGYRSDGEKGHDHYRDDSSTINSRDGDRGRYNP